MSADVKDTSSSPIVDVQGLRKAFGDRTVLGQINLKLFRGEFVALLGRSGSGKSTLLRMLAGLDPPDGGMAELPARTAVVFQEPRLMPWKSAVNNVMLGPTLYKRDVALRALAEVGLAERADAWPATLSGGEAQRVALARALVREPALLLLDEPFAALDALTRLRMHGLVRDLWRRHRPAVLLVTHDVSEAIMLAERILVLDEGRIIFEAVVAAGYPRCLESSDLAALKTTLLTRLGVDLERAA